MEKTRKNRQISWKHQKRFHFWKAPLFKKNSYSWNNQKKNEGLGGCRYIYYALNLNSFQGIKKRKSPVAWKSENLSLDQYLHKGLQSFWTRAMSSVKGERVSSGAFSQMWWVLLLRPGLVASSAFMIWEVSPLPATRRFAIACCVGEGLVWASLFPAIQVLPVFTKLCSRASGTLGAFGSVCGGDQWKVGLGGPRKIKEVQEWKIPEESQPVFNWWFGGLLS